MKKTLLTALAATLIASVAVPAMAAQPDRGPRHGPRIERLMERFDANQDGAVLIDEVSAQRLAMFESADTDSSGSLSKDELAFLTDMQKQQRDQNREERRTERKADGKMGQMGRHGDRDGRMAGKYDGKRDGMGRGEGMGRGDHRGGPRLERLDADNNGEVSLEEFTALDAKMFERFDRNGDKKIDITDFYGQRADNN
ncbi:MAG: hypothetical protein Q8O63_02645 [Hoeflea sp.]|nr:hypothetical protein [Hoeflea sp.]